MFLYFILHVTLCTKKRRNRAKNVLLSHTEQGQGLMYVLRGNLFFCFIVKDEMDFCLHLVSSITDYTLKNVY